jgi:hypothetical protein
MKTKHHNTSMNYYSVKLIGLACAYLFVISEHVSKAQVTFVSNGQQINKLAGRTANIGDLNGDEYLDAFVVNETDCRIYFGDGKGLFTESSQRIPLSGMDWMLKSDIGDINKDGKLDVIIGRTVWVNDGQGN